MRNKVISYAESLKLYWKLVDEEAGEYWPGKERPAEVVAKRLLAEGGFSGPPFFLGPNPKAEREKFLESELVDFDHAVRDMLWTYKCDNQEELIKRVPQIAFQLYMDVNGKLRKNAIDAVGFNGVSLDEIADGLPAVSYLIENVLAAGQPAVIAGPKKCMKTAISLDLTLSLTFKKPFLGHFRVPESMNVGLFSGESSLPVIAETVQRIARCKGISLEEINDDDGFVVLDDKLPILDDQRHLLALEGLILENELKVVIIDPLYLALNVGMESTNIYAMGNKLRDVMDLMRETGCTLILNHHFTKGNAVVKPDLVHMAAAGIQEYVRQWILLGRRKQYYPDKDAGKHKLWLNIGGSAGHSSFLALDIDEGPPPAVKFGDDDAESPSPDEADLKESAPPESGRKWDVKVSPPGEVTSSSPKKKIKGNGSKSGAPSVGELKKVVEFLKENPEGDTKSVIRNSVGLSTGRFDAVLKKLLADGTILECKIKRANNQSYDGYRLAGINGSET